MKAGEFPDGARTLRAKIDMASPNFFLRDPVLYRIMRAHHHRTGDAWCIYTLYEWFIRELGIYAPQQIEFARLNLTYTVLSKRRLIELVTGKYVRGWDDPRMPTIAGIRRRGYTPEAIRKFCERIGVTKFDSVHDITWLEDAL